MLGLEVSIRSAIHAATVLNNAALADTAFIGDAGRSIEAVIGALHKGNKILVAGNGGSAADAQHFVAEIVGTFMRRSRKAYPAVALSTDTSVLTSVGNDFSFDHIFARQIEAHGLPGDILIVLSTSGNSKNLLEAVAIARRKGLHTIAFLGKGGGALKAAADIAPIVPSDDTARIQEMHTLMLHCLAAEADHALL